MMRLQLFRRKKSNGNRLDDDAIPVDETKQEHSDSKETPVSWPTALQRVAAARNAKEFGNHFMPSRSRSLESHTKMIICPEMGKEILRLYEDCRQPVPCKNRNNEDDSDTDDNSIDSHNNAGKIDNHNQSLTTPSRVRLHKPVKPNKLLHHALTNANGEAWRRQRPLVQRALGDSTVTKSVAAPASVEAALQLLQMEHNQQAITRPMQTIEVRSFSLIVAAVTMIAAVFGKSSVDNQRKKQLQTAITNLFHPTLLPIRGDADKAAALDALVHEMVEKVASGCDASDSNPCLARNLLRHQHDNATTEPSSSSLSRQEVIGNCHSALLAGTQTIATTLAGSMLHWAEYKHELNTTSSSSQKSWFRDVVHETLRILPPVASLPRCPVNGDLEIPTADNNALKTVGSNTTAIPKGGVLLMDVLSMAHCPLLLLDNNDTIDTHGEFNTWKFCPVVAQDAFHQSKNSPTTRMQSPSYPWGFGDRKCPAGNLSVSCISAVLETLVVQKGLTWRLTKPDQDSVGELGTGGWMATVSY